MKDKRKAYMEYGDLLGFYEEIDNFVKENDPICEKGCSYCCHQFIGIFSFEKHYIKEAVKKLPPHTKEQVHANYLKLKEHFLKHAPDRKEISFPEAAECWGKLLAADYVACPLLVDNLCSIYEFRPFQCRWHFQKTERIYCMMNRLRNVCEEGAFMQAKFAYFLGRHDSYFKIEAVLMVLKEIFERKEKMDKIIVPDKLEAK